VEKLAAVEEKNFSGEEQRRLTKNTRAENFCVVDSAAGRAKNRRTSVHFC